MPLRVRWFVAVLTICLLTTGAVMYTEYTHSGQDVLESLAWGLIGGSVLIATTLVTGLVAAVLPHEPFPWWGIVLSVLAILFGVVWANLFVSLAMAGW